MRPSCLSPFLRLSAAKSPSLLNQVSRVSIGAFLTALSVSIGAAVSTPAASAQAVTFTGSGAVNFGSVNVCASGQTTPAPCSNTLTLSYNVTASGTLGTPQVLTTGAPDLDFTLASGSTCSGSVTTGNTCTVKVTFGPLAPGLRKGAVQIVDGSGNVLATTFIYGTATGPLIGFFSGGAPRNIGTGTPGELLLPNSIATDASGDVFVVACGCIGFAADPVVKEFVAVNGVIPDNPVTRVLTGSEYYPTGLAVDGAGNVFFTDNGNQYNHGAFPEYVREIVAAGGYTTIVTLNVDFADIYGVAVDGSGNVFVGDNGSASDPTAAPIVVEIFAAGGYTTTSEIGGSFAFLDPAALTMDSNGNLFIAESGFNGYRLEEFSAADGYSTARIIHVTGPDGGAPFSIAIDPAGNLFGLDAVSQDVLQEVLAIDGVLPTTPATVLLYTRALYPSAIAIDGRGNIFLSSFSSNLVQELPFSVPPPLQFATTPDGDTSSDSPQSIQIQNQGNATLDVTNLSVSPNWEQVSGSGTPEDCSASFSLIPGADCNVSISFSPTEAGPLTGAVTVVDNSLNVAGGTQSVPLSGTGVPPSITSVSANYGSLYALITLTGTNFGTSQGSRTVTFNGVPAAAFFWSNTSITVSVPGNATSGNIVVTAGGEASNGVPFTVEPQQPSITGMNPTSGAVGTVVTISGLNLLDAEGRGTVYLNEIRLPILNPTSTSLQVVVPAGGTSGAFDVHINGVGRYTPIFTVPGTPTTPQITGLSAPYGAYYAVITLTGTNFGASQGSSRVTFNLPSTSFSFTAVPTAWSNTSITLHVPYPADDGSVLANPAINNIVVTVSGRASNAAAFTVEPTPSVTGMSPTAGPPGTLVTISGQNLLDAGNRGEVWFGNVNAPIASASSTSIQVMVPAGATTGPIDVHVNGVGNYTPVFTVSP